MPSWHRTLLDYFVRTYCTILTRFYLPGIGIYSKVSLEGFENNAKTGPRIIVANHRCRLDSLMLMGLFKNTGVLIKMKYTKSPLYAAFVHFLDFIGVDPSSLESLSIAMTKSKRLIAQGKNLLIFPEGSRAASGRMLPFRDFAFRIACSTNTPITPILLHTTVPFMAKIKGSIFPPTPFAYRVIKLPDVFPEQNERPQNLALRVREIMEQALKNSDKGTFWDPAVPLAQKV
jgi:1-acyl-sn-glycerol-3-phosphate acyltransferase